MKSWIWFVEVSLLGFNLNSTTYAGNLHSSADGEGEEETKRYEATPQTPNRFNAIGAGFVGRLSPASEVPHDPAKTSSELRGKIIKGGTECPLFQSDDGKLYTILGPVGDLAEGQEATMTGDPVARSFCMEGSSTFVVHDIKKIK